MCRRASRHLVTSNAVPGESFKSIVTAVAGLGRPDRNAGPLRQFEVTLELERPEMPVCDQAHRSRSSFKARASRTRSNCRDKPSSIRTASRSCMSAAPVPQVSSAARSRFFTALKVGWRSMGWPGNRGGSCRSERGVKTKPSAAPAPRQDLEFLDDRRLAVLAGGGWTSCRKSARDSTTCACTSCARS